jgi:hypothetical protein
VWTAGNLESCTLATTRVLYATATFFSTESFFDYVLILGSTQRPFSPQLPSILAPRFSLWRVHDGVLVQVTMNGVRFSGTSGPLNVLMHEGATLMWHADGSVTFEGYPPTPTPNPRLWPDAALCCAAASPCPALRCSGLYPALPCAALCKTIRVRLGFHSWTICGSDVRISRPPPPPSTPPPLPVPPAPSNYVWSVIDGSTL